MTDVREALLDAAYAAAVTTGWQRARMADVAAAAGVSRQTLYNEFGDREGLALHLALRETQRFLDGVERAMDRHAGNLLTAFEAAARFALDEADGNPLVRSILTETGDAGLLPYLTTRAQPLVGAARQRVAAYLTSHWPEFSETADDVGEVVVRLTLSYIVLAGPARPAAARRIAAVAATLLERAPA